jgi:hypothetical protein
MSLSKDKKFFLKFKKTHFKIFTDIANSIALQLLLVRG